MSQRLPTLSVDSLYDGDGMYVAALISSDTRSNKPLSGWSPCSF